MSIDVITMLWALGQGQMMHCRQLKLTQQTFFIALFTSPVEVFLTSPLPLRAWLFPRSRPLLPAPLFSPLSFPPEKKTNPSGFPGRKRHLSCISSLLGFLSTLKPFRSQFLSLTGLFPLIKTALSLKEIPRALLRYYNFHLISFLYLKGYNI